MQANISFSGQWGTGLIGKMDVSNNAEPLNNWTVTFDAPFQIVNIWNATILSQTSLGQGVLRYVVGAVDWNAAVPPNGGVSFGFQGEAAANIQAQVSGIRFGTTADLATPPSVTLSDASIQEGPSGTREMVFTIALSKASAEAVTIPWSTEDGTALSGSDYRAAAGSVTFAPGETSKTISVTILGDALVEGNESFNLVLGVPSGATIADGTGLGTILNDDVLPSLSIGHAQTTEGDSGTKQLVFTVTLSQAAAGPVTVAYTTRDGTALAGSDYDALSGSLSFAAGETSKTIAVTLRGDAVDEIDESFELALSGLTGASFAQAMARGTILNDDAPPVLSVSNAEVIEGASGTRNMVFTLSLTKAIAQSVTTRFATADGTALAGSDYVAKSGTVTFAAGQTTKTVSIAIHGDRLVEADESFNLLLSNVTRASLAPGGGVGTIRNDDLPPPTLTISDAQVTEGDAGTKQMLFTVALSRAATSAVSVTYATQAGTATAGSDFTAASGTLRFAAGETSKTIAVTVRGNTVVEADESFSLLLGTATGATIADGTGLGTILNDDVPPSLTISDAQLTEGHSGTNQMLFTVALSRAAASAVSVTYATQAGTATGGSDFTAKSGTLSFAAGEMSKTIAVTVRGDTMAEADEGFSLLLGTATGATIADGTGLGTILNDDVLPTLSIADAQVIEGDAGTKQMLFTVTLSRAAGSAVSVAYATEAGTATAGSDFTATSGTLSFAAGETSKTIAVNILGDATVEANEGFSLLLSSPSGATLLDGSALGTITNDDTAPAPAPASGDTASFRVTQGWNGGFLAEMTVLNDAIPLEGWTLSFDAPFQINKVWNAELVSHVGQTYVIRNAAWNADLGPIGSTSFGMDVTGSGTPQNISVNGGAPVPGLTIADASLTEGDAGSAMMNFTIRLTTASATPVTVGYATADGSALAGQDYLASAGSLTFAPGETSKTLSVAVLGDALREGSESFSLNLTAPAGLRLLDGQAQGSIRDNDAPPASLPPPGYYSTSGNQIIDEHGDPVRLKSVNWFGMEGYLGVPDGLYTRNWQDMMEQMKEVGFDSIRLPFSLQNIQPGVMPNNIVYSINPDLRGLSNLEVMDKVVDYAGKLGMKIILDCHRSSSGNGPNENGLWYDNNFTEAQWIDTWKSLAQRYDGNSTVIGMDLQNEPHAASWADWSAAVERAGNAIHEVNPELLIIVEGVSQYQGASYWWGGQLAGVRDDPVVLNQANKVVYSPHDYPNSVWPQQWFQVNEFPENMPQVFRDAWGFIFEEGIAPIYLGEFGSELIAAKDIAWMDKIVQYLNGDFNTDGVVDIPDTQEGMSFAYWSWNPNSSYTGGILMDDWATPHAHKLAAIEPLLFG
ncbi:MAG: cellulase family glycosylhydrolase [Roseococcus sp.]|nr:cellulase family glycosylhydrolase [Roseococcus sp.]